MGSDNDYQDMSVVELATPIPCGIPHCPNKTAIGLFEAWNRGFYDTMEIAPYCPDHELEMQNRWMRRYGDPDDDNEADNEADDATTTPAPAEPDTTEWEVGESRRLGSIIKNTQGAKAPITFAPHPNKIGFVETPAYPLGFLAWAVSGVGVDMAVEAPTIAEQLRRLRPQWEELSPAIRASWAAKDTTPEGGAG